MKFKSLVILLTLLGWGSQLWGQSDRVIILEAETANPRLLIAKPTGTVDTVDLERSTFLGEAFRRKYPRVKTFTVADPTRAGVVTLAGAQVLADLTQDGGWVNFGPRNIPPSPLAEPACASAELDQPVEPRSPFGPSALPPATDLFVASNGATRREYDLVAVGTGEFYQLNGSDLTQAAGIIAQSVAFADLVFERDLNVTIRLADAEIYTDSLTDPFIPDQAGGDSRVNQAAEAVEMNFAATGYDLGMVFHTTRADDFWSSGGVAFRPAICNDNVLSENTSDGNPNEPDGRPGRVKAGGWSGSRFNDGIGWLRLLTHEMGHMFGGSHTFNGAGNSCTNNTISASAAVEIGAGTTILSYADICAPSYLISYDREESSYFHPYNLDEMLNVITNRSCPNTSDADNQLPSLEDNPCGATGPLRIPLGTPFLLRAEGSDADGDPITYAWDQFDEDGTDSPTQGATLNQPGTNGETAGESTVAPLFRTYAPDADPARRFPAAVDGRSTEFEVLPEVARDMTFGIIVKDNHPGGGGYRRGLVTVTATEDGPLSFAGIPGTEPVQAGANYAFSWNTNGSDDLCTTARVQLSTDGGSSYPFDLGPVTYAAGSANLTIPSGTPATDAARFRLICDDTPCRTFYAVSQSLRNVENADCAVTAPRISPVSTVYAAENTNELNLDQTASVGNPLTFPVAGTLRQDAPTSPFVYGSSDRDNPSCTATSRTTNFTSFLFVPELSGEYVFSYNGAFGNLLSIHEDTFDPEAGCASFLNSTFVSSENTVYPTVTVDLVAGQRYEAVVMAFSSNFPDPAEYPVDFTVNLESGPAEATFTDNLPAPSGYTLTYLAVADNDRTIADLDPTADFRDLSDGNYLVYGIQYPESINSMSWVGQNLSAVIGTDDAGCRVMSSNRRRFVVTPAQGTALPLRWLTIAATDEGDHVRIDWVVDRQEDNQDFLVERSPDGVDWKSLHRIRGDGTKSGRSAFTYADLRPLPGTSYYRVRQEDFDGTQTVSRTVSVARDRIDLLSESATFPNPFSEELTVLTDRPIQGPVRLTDTNGKHYGITPAYDADRRRMTIAPGTIPPGVYYLSVNGIGLRIVKAR
jgi:hypothetical protein